MAFFVAGNGSGCLKLLEEFLNAWMVKHVGIEHVVGCATFDDVDDLFDTALVETDGRFD